MTPKEIKRRLKQARKKLELVIEDFEKQEGFPEKVKIEDFEKFWKKRAKHIQPYQERVGILSAKYRQVRKPKMEPLCDIGNLYTFKEFKAMCKGGGFIDYDGFGRYSTETKTSDIYIYPSDFKDGIVRDDFTHVMWYNR